MRSRDEFIKIIDNKFFTHIIKESLVPFVFTNRLVRVNYLSEIYDEVISNFLNYRPTPPRKYISTPKNNLAIRMVPSFDLKEYCIYYFCIKLFENFIAENRVPNTFGNYKLGSLRKKIDAANLVYDNEDSISSNSVSLNLWKEEYSNYTNTLKEYSLLLKQGRYNFVGKIDIANFYDCIRLDILSRKIKAALDYEDFSDELHILFNFLKFWNIKYDKNKSVGIPQDEIGDCSRILANFYLQDYDVYMRNECLKIGADYIRYADDQLFFAYSEEDVRSLIFLASEKLFEYGLNINCSKLKIFNNYNELDAYYSFSIFNQIENGFIKTAAKEFIKKVNNKTEFRWTSVLRKILNRGSLKYDDIDRFRMLSIVLSEEFLLQSNSYYFAIILDNLLDVREKNNFLNSLEEIYKSTLFESFKLEVNKFYKKRRVDINIIKYNS